MRTVGLLLPDHLFGRFTNQLSKLQEFFEGVLLLKSLIPFCLYKFFKESLLCHPVRNKGVVVRISPFSRGGGGKDLVGYDP